MTKSYELSESVSIDGDKEVTISEPTTSVRKTSVNRLKREHINILQEIERSKVRADAIATELTAINDNTDITVSDIPVKLIK